MAPTTSVDHLPHNHPTKTNEHTTFPRSDTSSTKTSPWHAPPQSRYDLRSDTITTPTPSMLHAISQASLSDDVFSEDATTNTLQTFCASLLGHASALLVLSGTMGNQVALRAHLAQTQAGPPFSVLLDRRSHIYGWEGGGGSAGTGAQMLAVRPREGKGHLNLDDVKAEVVLDTGDVHACPTRVLCLENTLGGEILPLETAREITGWAREQGLKTHLDGARLWEAAAAWSGDVDEQKVYLKEYARLFDSVTLCFSKGLGAPVGSILVGSEGFVRKSRHFRKQMGGGLRQTGVIAAPARVSVEETFLGGRLRGGHEMARRVEEAWEGLGGRVEREVQTNMVWLDLGAAGVSREEWVEACRREGVRVLGGRLVCHYQVEVEEVMDRLRRAMNAVFQERKINGVNGVVKNAMANATVKSCGEE